MKRILTQIFLIITLATSALQAQVTIGSVDVPASGALLDLKEDNVTSKGLGMPRVMLTNLIPNNASELAASIGSVGSWALSEHTALAVYNVKEDRCWTEPIYEGLYVFDGDRWQYIGDEDKNSPKVQYYVDDRPQLLGSQNYPYLIFGAAGEWMLENIRYVPPIGSPIELTANVGGSDEDLNRNDKFYIYPNANPANPEVAPVTWTPAQGLLYSYSAATLGSQDDVSVNQGYNEGGEASQPVVEGICPPGWHIPTDREWDKLEEEVYNNAKAYSIYGRNELSDPLIWNPISAANEWDASWNGQVGYRGSGGSGGHSFAMQSICSLANTGVTYNGKSYPVRQGGFDALLVGRALEGVVERYDSHAYFWVSSTENTNNAWYRHAVRTNPKMYRDTNLRYCLFSIRCMR